MYRESGKYEIWKTTWGLMTDSFERLKGLLFKNHEFFSKLLYFPLSFPKHSFKTCKTLGKDKLTFGSNRLFKKNRKFFI